MTIPETPAWGDKKRVTRTRWQRLADERWPDAMDMVAPAYGTGRWATLAWCAALTVHLHPTRRLARRALHAIDRYACGHGCWRDHELVDLSAPDAVEPQVQARRAERRAAHLAACRVCRYVYDGRGPAAVWKRHRAAGGRP